MAGIGADFARQWLQRAAERDVEDLIAQRPEIPGPLDAGLLRHAEAAMGLSLKENDGTRRRLRRAFWDAVMSAPSTSRQTADPDDGA